MRDGDFFDSQNARPGMPPVAKIAPSMEGDVVSSSSEDDDDVDAGSILYLYIYICVYVCLSVCTYYNSYIY